MSLEYDRALAREAAGRPPTCSCHCFPQQGFRELKCSLKPDGVTKHARGAPAWASGGRQAACGPSHWGL
eukprot:2525231-Pyramimonas_sp.AAC.1